MTQTGATEAQRLASLERTVGQHAARLAKHGESIERLSRGTTADWGRPMATPDSNPVEVQPMGWVPLTYFDGEDSLTVIIHGPWARAAYQRVDTLAAELIADAAKDQTTPHASAGELAGDIKDALEDEYEIRLIRGAGHLTWLNNQDGSRGTTWFLVAKERSRG